MVRIILTQCNRRLAPKPARGFHQDCADLPAHKRFIVYPGEERFSLGARVTRSEDDIERFDDRYGRG